LSISILLFREYDPFSSMTSHFEPLLARHVRFIGYSSLTGEAVKEMTRSEKLRVASKIPGLALV